MILWQGCNISNIQSWILITLLKIGPVVFELWSWFFVFCQFYFILFQWHSNLAQIPSYMSLAFVLLNGTGLNIPVPQGAEHKFVFTFLGMLFLTLLHSKCLSLVQGDSIESVLTIVFSLTIVSSQRTQIKIENMSFLTLLHRNYLRKSF